MRRPEIRILTRSPRRFAARCRIFLGLGISVLECGSETVTHRRAAGQGSLITSHFCRIHIPAIWNQYGLGNEIRASAAATIFSLRGRQSFPQRLALADVHLVIEGVVKEHGVGCCLQKALSTAATGPLRKGSPPRHPWRACS